MTKPLSAAIVLAMAAPVLAAATWFSPNSMFAFINFAPPVILAEMAVIWLASRAGFQVFPAFSRLSRHAQIALVAWAIVVVLAAIGAKQFPTAIIHAAITLLHGLFALALWDRFSGHWQDERRKVLIALAGGVVAYAVLVHLFVITVLGDPIFNWHAFQPGVSNERQIAFYGLSLSGIALGLLATERAPRRQWLYGTLLLLGYYLVDWSGGRAGFGGSITAAALVLVLTPRQLRGRTILTAAAAFILAMPLSLIMLPDASWGFQTIVGRISPAGQGAEAYASGRLEIWLQTVQAILEKPLLGHGQGQFRENVAAALGVFNHPHNAVLQFLYQWGFIGTLGLAVALLVVPTRLVSHARTNPRVALPAIGVLTGMVTMSMLEGNFFHQYPIMVSLVCLAALMSIRPDEATKAS